jgi:hypothetical protein
MDLKSSSGELRWNAISVDPGESQSFPQESAASRYYAARETSSSSLSVNSPSGSQSEKFLFYRGVSSFSVPASALPMNGDRIFVSNRAQAPIPQAILFERRGEKLGYRVLGPLRNSAIVEPPDLSADIASLSRDMEAVLVAQGLYPDEARAMIATWNDSWFEAGTRLLYIVPRPFVDNVLPLDIHPAPANIARVFVGRMEIVTPATERAVETAFATGDHATLATYGRFLAPILQVMIARSNDEARTARLRGDLNSVYNRLYAFLRDSR